MDGQEVVVKVQHQGIKTIILEVLPLVSNIEHKEYLLGSL